MSYSSDKMQKAIDKLEASFYAEDVLRAIPEDDRLVTDYERADAIYNERKSDVWKLTKEEFDIDDMFEFERVHLKRDRKDFIPDLFRHKQEAMENLDLYGDALTQPTELGQYRIDSDGSENVNTIYSAIFIPKEGVQKEIIHKLEHNVDPRAASMDAEGTKEIVLGEYKWNRENLRTVRGEGGTGYSDNDMCPGWTQAELAARFHYGNTLTLLGMDWQQWPLKGNGEIREIMVKDLSIVDKIANLENDLQFLRAEPEGYQHVCTDNPTVMKGIDGLPYDRGRLILDEIKCWHDNLERDYEGNAITCLDERRIFLDRAEEIYMRLQEKAMGVERTPNAGKAMEEAQSMGL